MNPNNIKKHILSNFNINIIYTLSFTMINELPISAEMPRVTLSKKTKIDLHTTDKCLDQLRLEGLIEWKKKGRCRMIRLTERGCRLKVHLTPILNEYFRKEMV